MNEWISVKDKLPEKGECILAYNGLIVSQCYYIGDGIFTVICGVTHWMPLPEPPKDE